MPAPWRRLAVTCALLVGLVVLVAAGLGLLGGAVLLPQLGAVGWVAIGLVAFLAVQLLMFRLFGLRSRADEEPGDDTGDAPDESGRAGEPERAEEDWRAWRG